MPPREPQDAQFEELDFIEQISVSNITTVWKATVQMNNQEEQIAYKTVPDDAWDSGPSLDHIITEADVLDTLQHCDAVPLLIDYGTLPRPWIATEFLEGNDLREILTKVTFQQGIRILKRVCEAIQCAHRSEIVHTDLKPENVITGGTASEATLVIDWGGANNSEKSTLDAFTTPYAAPEQIADEPTSPRTDIYQIAILAYEVITGIQPFRSDQENELRFNILHQDPTPIHVLASEQRFEPIDEVIATALAKDPTNRYTTAKQFYVELLNAIRDVSAKQFNSQNSGDNLAGVKFSNVDSSTFNELVQSAQAGYDVDTAPIHEWDLFSEIEDSLRENRQICSDSQCEHIHYNEPHQVLRYCSYCGEPLSGATAKSDGLMMSCPDCGAENLESDLQYCVHCGAALDPGKDSDTIIRPKDSDTVIEPGAPKIALGGGVDPELVLHLVEGGVILIQASKYSKSATEYVSEWIRDIESSSDTPTAESEELSEEEIEKLFDEYVVDESLEWN